MTRVVAVVLVAALTIIGLGSASTAVAGPCVGRVTTHCGSVHARGDQEDFHGLIAVTGIPSVFQDAAHSGTKPACGDCEWTLIAACPKNDPSDPNAAKLCTEATNAATCRRGVLERLYLSDADTDYRLIATLCIRKANQVIAIGDRARADVAQYLRDVTPPDLEIDIRPRLSTLAGLLTKFRAHTPAQLRPAPFGGGGITETITIAPIQSNWSWGDGDATGWVTTAATTTHRYIAGGVEHGSLTTRWGATYTITFEGETFGPYDAVGQLTRQQAFVLPVHTSTPHLVSQ